ncbi:MAG: hypothetical protein ACREBU_09950 [Nitrososphaera sp.]
MSTKKGMDTIPKAIMESEQMARYLRTIHNDFTKENSLRTLSLFIRNANAKKPEDLFGSTTKIEELIERWIDSQKTQKPPVMGTTIRVRFHIVKDFYEMNRVLLAWKLLSKTIPKTRAKRDTAWTRDNLQTLLAKSRDREQAVIPLLASSGIRRDVLRLLNVEDFLPRNDWAIFEIVGYRGEPEEYHTYCSPEARKNIESYWRFRERHGEILTAKSPAFRKEWNLEDPNAAKNPKRLAERTVSSALREVALKTGLRQKLNGPSQNGHGAIRHESKLVHGIRKFFETTLLDLGFDEKWIDMLEGHKLEGLRENYYRPKDDTVLLGTTTSDGKFRKPGYVDLMRELVISDEERAKVKVRELEKKIIGEERMVKRMDELEEELNDLRQKEYWRDVEDHPKRAS